MDLTIRLDSEIIVLHGPEANAPSQSLRGVVVLYLAAPVRVKGVYLRMTGKCRIGWDDRVAASWKVESLFDKSWKIFRHEWASFINMSPESCSKHTWLQAGRYEWPFELEIAGSMKESIEGMCNSYISYDLQATVKRGTLRSDLRDQKPVRILRAYRLAALSPTGPLYEDGIWQNKIEYEFCIPQGAIAFGSAFTIYMRLATLLKGIKIAVIRCALIESQQFRVPGVFAGTSFKRHRTVKEWQFESACENEYTSQEVLLLPKRFSLCAPDTDLSEIEVRHEMRIRLDLKNPDGHISELLVRFPVTIFFSSNTVFDGDSCNTSTPRGRHTGHVDIEILPVYDDHILDLPFTDLAIATGEEDGGTLGTLESGGLPPYTTF